MSAITTKHLHMYDIVRDNTTLRIYYKKNLETRGIEEIIILKESGDEFVITERMLPVFWTIFDRAREHQLMCLDTDPLFHVR